jgi:hypothetical protein
MCGDISPLPHTPSWSGSQLKHRPSDCSTNSENMVLYPLSEWYMKCIQPMCGSFLEWKLQTYKQPPPHPALCFKVAAFRYRIYRSTSIWNLFLPFWLLPVGVPPEGLLLKRTFCVLVGNLCHSTLSRLFAPWLLTQPHSSTSNVQSPGEGAATWGATETNISTRSYQNESICLKNVKIRHISINMSYEIGRSWGSSVNIVTEPRAERLGFDSRQG